MVCPPSSDPAKPTRPGEIEVGVSGDEFLSVRCGSSSSRIVAEDLDNEFRRCRTLAPPGAVKGRLAVKGDPPVARVFEPASLLQRVYGERSISVLIAADGGLPPIEYRAWDVCHADPPADPCTRVSIEVLPSRLALEAWSSDEGPCASPRRRARPYGAASRESVPPRVAVRSCHVETVGETREQLARLGERLADLGGDGGVCSVGTVHAHRDVPWSRIANVLTELRSWTGEAPALTLAAEDPGAASVGCDAGR